MVGAAGAALGDDLLRRVGCEVLVSCCGFSDTALVAGCQVVGQIGAGAGGRGLHDLVVDAAGEVVDVGLGGVGMLAGDDLASTAGSVGQFVQGRLVEGAAGGGGHVVAARHSVPGRGCGGRCQAPAVGGPLAGLGRGEQPGADAFAARCLGGGGGETGCAAGDPSCASGDPSCAAGGLVGGSAGGASCCAGAVGGKELGGYGSRCQAAYCAAYCAADRASGGSGCEGASRGAAA